VAVVAAAGNDATSRLLFPAAFAPHPGGTVDSFDSGCVPLISVGALNPNGTVALFSNAGAWVLCTRPGAGLVSTFPITFQASGEPSYRTRTGRETMDPDDFSAGFGTWSGTSFAAPVLAGELAQAMAGGNCGSMLDLDVSSTVARGWAAVSACTAYTP
jgi:subtilisin family serine protease